MRAYPKQDRQEALTRLDVIATLAISFLMLGLFLSRLSAADALSERQTCRDNLETIGKAFAAWAKDHQNKMPWLLKREEGGNHGLSSAGNAWVQMAWLSNHLASPALLACPSDKVRPATEWSRSSAGFWNVERRDNALSYFVGLDVSEQAPKSFLSGDRTAQVTARVQRCNYADVRTAVNMEPGDERLRWLEAGHGDPSNILLFDGSVHSFSSEQLRAAAEQTKAVHAENHALWPRPIGQ